MEKIIPFSNGQDYLHWMEINCFQCPYYESKSTNIEKANCFMAYELDLASVSNGSISKLAASFIGFKDGLMPKTCSKYQLKSVKFDFNRIKQLTLTFTDKENVKEFYKDIPEYKNDNWIDIDEAFKFEKDE